MKAKLLKSLRIGGALIAPRADKVTLVELDDAEYERLLDLGKILKPTADELKVGTLAYAGPEAADTGKVQEPKAGATKGADKPKTEAKSDGKSDDPL